MVEPIEERILAADLADRERYWIERLGTLLPAGLNRNRGGAMGGGGRRPVEHQGERFSSVGVASVELARRHGLTESAAHQRLRKGKDLEAPLKVSRTRGRGVWRTSLWARWRSMRNNATSELEPFDGHYLYCSNWRQPSPASSLLLDALRQQAQQ